MSIRMAASFRRSDRGFSLVEVLVALIVLAVGLLGIAKMEALAISNITVANRRSLAAIEAQSLADAMHLNRGFWSTAAANAAVITVSGTTVTNAPVAPAPNCLYQPTAPAPCTPAGLASWDLEQWANDLSRLLPNDQATITCNNSAPIDCLITITWSEDAVALNNAQVQTGTTTATESAIQNPTYTLYVEP